MLCFFTATVISTTPLRLHLNTAQQSCAHCAEHGGCGQSEKPWFRAQLPNTLTLTSEKRFALHDTVRLAVDSRALTIAAYASYGLPLLGLFGGLLSGQGLHEAWQMACGLLGLLLGAQLAKRFEPQWLRRYVTIEAL